MKTAKKLKKNNVAVDIVSFGCEEENSEKLEGFQQAVNSGDNSHLVTVPQGGVLSDSLFGSSICQTDGGAGYGAPGGDGGEAGGSYQFGVDPNLDPELALALRVSMEEEQARQTTGPSGEAAPASGSEPMQGGISCRCHPYSCLCYVTAFQALLGIATWHGSASTNGIPFLTSAPMLAEVLPSSWTLVRWCVCKMVVSNPLSSQTGIMLSCI